MENYPELKVISWSALKDHKDCSWYFLLKNVLKLEVFTASVHTHYGTLLHRIIQDVLTDKLEPQVGSDQFVKVWTRFCRFYQKQLERDGHKGMSRIAKSAATAILGIKDSFKKQFGEYKVLSIEEPLKIPLGDYPQLFRGSIDIVIELADGKKIIVDFKTCNTRYFYLKNKDKYSDYQLTLYKYFFRVKHNIVNEEDIETYFAVIEKNAYNKDPLFFLRITSGEKKVENALEWLENALSAINKGIFLKNRYHCQAYGRPCTFYNTEHCSLSNQPQKSLLTILS